MAQVHVIHSHKRQDKGGKHQHIEMAHEMAKASCCQDFSFIWIHGVFCHVFSTATGRYNQILFQSQLSPSLKVYFEKCSTISFSNAKEYIFANSYFVKDSENHLHGNVKVICGMDEGHLLWKRPHH